MLSLGTSVTGLGWGQRGASKCSEFASYTTNPYEEHFHHAETTQAGRLPETPYAHGANSPAGSTTAIEACADEQHLRECFERLGGGGGLLECRDFRIGLCLLQGQYVSTRQAYEVQHRITNRVDPRPRVSLVEWTRYAMSMLSTQSGAQRADTLEGLRLHVPALDAPVTMLSDPVDQRAVEAALSTASQAVDVYMTPLALVELRSFRSPPAAVEDALAAALILIGRHDEATSWPRMRNVLRERAAFVGELDEFAHALIRGGVPEKAFAQVEPFLAVSRVYHLPTMEKVCLAAAGLSSWVKYMHEVYCILTGRPRDPVVDKGFKGMGQKGFKDICDACKSLTSEEQIKDLASLAKKEAPAKAILDLFSATFNLSGCQDPGWGTAQTILHPANVHGFLRMLRSIPGDVIRHRINPGPSCSRCGPRSDRNMSSCRGCADVGPGRGNAF